jgi:TatD DNase family protein
MLTDTHAHLDFEDFQNDLEDVIGRARAAGVNRIITIGTTIEGCRRSLELAEKFSPTVFAAVGIHPNEAWEVGEVWLEELQQMARHPRVVAIGECGLDYHRPPMPDPALSPTAALGATTSENLEHTITLMRWKEQQAYVFRMQLELAAQLGLNVIVHQRDSWTDCLNILDEAPPGIRAVFHCFSGTRQQAEELINRGHLISFTGIVTFKNAEEIRQVVASIPDNSFMVETDCPYLAPAPHRGSRCEPAHVVETAKKIAEVRRVHIEALSELTEKTAESFFHWKR